jgi:hypothetical protein
MEPIGDFSSVRFHDHGPATRPICLLELVFSLNDLQMPNPQGDQEESRQNDLKDPVCFRRKIHSVGSRDSFIPDRAVFPWKKIENCVKTTISFFSVGKRRKRRTRL